MRPGQTRFSVQSQWPAGAPEEPDTAPGVGSCAITCPEGILSPEQLGNPKSRGVYLSGLYLFQLFM